jgi:hypothetical protein
MTAIADLPGYDLPHGQVAIGAHVNPNGHTVIASGERFWGWTGKITLGGVLLTSAGLLLLALAVAMGIVSWHAQFAFIYAVKHQRLAASLEALGLDCGAVVFSILGIALARLGRRAVIERALVCICAAGSCAMNAAGSDLGSPRSVAAFVMPPLLFAITSDRLISVIRRSALGRLADDEAQRSAWRLAGTACLYVLRFAVAPPSTAKGARQALLNATQLPATDMAAQMAGSAPAALAASTSRQPRAKRPASNRTGPTKAEQLLARAAERRDLATMPLDQVSSLAVKVAAEIGLHPGTARRVLLSHVRQIQAIPVEVTE